MQEDCKTSYSATPARPGNLKLKCILWPNCPTYRRSLQDQAFIFSPETLKYAPQSIRNNLVSIDNLDGVFLRPVPNFHIDNYISFPDVNYKPKKVDKKQEGEDSIEKDKYESLWKKVLPLEALEFLPLDKNISSNLLNLEGSFAIESSAVASHQTWISDGSLYCSTNLNASENTSTVFSLSKKTLCQKYFCTKWSYIYEKVGQSLILNNSNKDLKTESSQKGNVVKPTAIGISATGSVSSYMDYTQVDPIEFVAGETVNSKFWRDINPGIHWRMLKRTPIFQGEDFTVEFTPTHPESAAIKDDGDRFRMLDKFYFLDVFSNRDTVVCGSLGSDGIIDKKTNQEIINNIKKTLDFSRQIYYMIEIGVGDPDHNYWLIIAENTNPIFCHVGRTPKLYCNVVNSISSTVPAPSKGQSQSSNCIDQTTNNLNPSPSYNRDSNRFKEVITVQFDDQFPVLRKLSTYAISSKTLLDRESLKISIRQHSGNIVVTFSGHEDTPWVITRTDIDLEKTPLSTPKENKPLSESQVVYKTKKMLIPFGQIALMGGNRKCSFSFSPMIYNKLSNYLMPQSFSVQGPVNVSNIEFLWREKGGTNNPEVSTIKNTPVYINEAGNFGEIALSKDKKNKKSEIPASAKYTLTSIKEVQPNYVNNFGKAPDMIGNKKAEKYGIQPSYLGVLTSECLANQGSNNGDSKLMQVTISVIPGGYLFPAIDGGEPWALEDCVTPILYSLRMKADSGGKAYNKSPIDVSHHVLSFGDDWSETDWKSIEHSGSISFLISSGMKFKNNQSEYIRTLADKTFYLQVSLWWEDGIMPTPKDERDRIVFTGFCHGGTIQTETNKQVLSCRINDYTKILKDQFFYNSPFFDRMRDVNAVNDILQLAGFRDGNRSDQAGAFGGFDISMGTEEKSTFLPASLVSRMAESEEKDGWYNFIFNGEKIYNREYTLTGSYDILQAPLLKFAEGDVYWSAITRFSDLANKVVYFDRLGIFHFEPLPYDQEIWGAQKGIQTNWSIRDWAALSKGDFFATPVGMTKPDMANQIIGDYSVERIVQDVVNDIKVLSTTPDGEVLIAGHVNYPSLNDPESPGFLGYRKTYFQMDGSFGSESTVKWIINNYTRMFIPPIKVSFKAFGRNNIKALDVITFQPLGSREKQPLIISSVKNIVNPETNMWEQEFEGLWMFPRQNVSWGVTNEIGLGLNGSISGSINGNQLGG